VGSGELGAADMGSDFARAFVSFLAIVDPLGNVLVFYLLTRALPFATRVGIAVLAVATAGAMLVLFSLGGREVLAFLGISAESFRVAAGLLLMLPAYRLVTRGQPTEADEEKALDPLQLALVPLAMAMLAGPGALATTISFAGTLGLRITLLALGLVLLISFGSFVAADRLFRWLGPSWLRLLSPIIGLLLFAISVEFVLQGLRAFFLPA
jgi:multiple antibiotic resistance protein